MPGPATSAAVPAPRTRLRLTGGPGPRSLLVALAAASLPGAAGAQDAAAGPAVVAARAGGTTLVCRHAKTGSFREREPVSYRDTTTQRLLSEAGEDQSRALGEAFRRLGIRFGEVVASPMSRARRTAELMAPGPVVVDSIWHTNDGDYRGPSRDRRIRVLETPPDEANRLVVSHVVTIRSVLPGTEGRLGEGDCAVVAPSEDGFELVGVVPWETWLRRADGG